MEFDPSNANHIARIAEDDVTKALAEDIGDGDLTAHLIDAKQTTQAHIVARESGVLCGVAWVQAAIHRLDAYAKITWYFTDGQHFSANDVIVKIQGSARHLLTTERTALNFLQLLSGIATKVAAHVAVIQHTKTKVVDTRKTLPGLRLAQKYAVYCGGGTNHRIGLFDAILIKENHIASAGSIAAVLERANALVAKIASEAALMETVVADEFPMTPTPKFIEVEVEDLVQLTQALDAGATMILLDNMSIPMLHKAVLINNHRAILEVSGGVTMQTLLELAHTGVDRISIGALTKDVKAIDFSMRFDVLDTAVVGMVCDNTSQTHHTIGDRPC